MAEVHFYEKPGCINNRKQQEILRGLGHTLYSHDLLMILWTSEHLRPFFGERPLTDWFNYTAPRIKSGEIDPATLDEAGALAAMVADPLLIRRPLIECEFGQCSGFDEHPVLQALAVYAPPEGIETCPKSHAAKPCSAPA
ncbi:MAG: ArsC/Spx/MgsR family protein [Thiothrix sp.]